MKRMKYILSCIMLSCATYALADDVNTLVIKLQNGTEEKFCLADRPIITMPDDNVVINHQSIDATYKRSEVETFYFLNNPAVGIDQIASSTITYSFADANTFCINGLQENVMVRIVSADGKLVNNLQSDSAGAVNVPLAHLKGGVYVITFGGRSIKVKR